MRRGVALGIVAVVLLTAACRVEENEHDHDFCGEFGCVRLSRGEPIQLATLLDRSGPMSEIGNDSHHGALLAADYIDGSFDGTSAQLLGREIAFKHKDDRCTAEHGSDGARELLSEHTDKLTAVIGGTCDAGTLGVADQIFTNEGITMISPSIPHPWLTDPNTHAEFFFRTAHNGLLESKALAAFAARKLDAETILLPVISNFEGEVHAFRRFFLQQGDVQSELITLEPDEADVAAIAERLEVDGQAPDAIYLPIDPDGAMATARAARSAGLRRVPLLGEEYQIGRVGLPDSLDPNQTAYIAGPDLEISGEFYDTKFLPAYRKRFGEPTSAYHAHAFDATMLVLRAIESVAIIDETEDVLMIPRMALRDAIAATEDFEGVSALLTCDQNGDCNPLAPMVVRRIDDKGDRIIWRSEN